MLSMDEIEYQHKALSLNPICGSSSLLHVGFFISGALYEHEHHYT